MRLRTVLPFLAGSGGLILSLIIPVAGAGTPNGDLPPVSQPVPAAVNAWAVLFQARQRLDEPAGREQTENTRGDLVLSGAALRALQAENGKTVPVNIQIATQLQNLIQQNAGMVESGGGKVPEKGYVDLEKLYDVKLIEQARALANQYRCAMHPEVVGPKGTGCPRCGMALNSQVRLTLDAAKPGFYRLFVQVQRNGQSEFVPFALNIPLGKMPSEWEKNNCSSGKSGPTVFDYGIRITKTTLRQQRARAAHRCKNDGDPS